MKKRRGSMKTIALTLFAAVLGMAQNQSSTSTQAPPPAKTATPATKTAAPARASNAPSKAQGKKPAQAARTPPQQKGVAQPQTIPAGAVLVEPFMYRYTDSSGKTWMYRQTPFGLSRWEESSIPEPQTPAAKSEPVAVTDLGDSVRFEKKTPFGAGTWVRKKTELTDDEKAIIAGQQEQSKPAPASSDTKPAGNQ